MKKIITVILLCSVSTLIFSQENKNIDISKLVISSFQKNEFSKIPESFDQTMKNALPVEKLKLVWDDLNIKCGKFQKISTITVSKIQNYDVTYILCHFEKMNLKMKTVFDEKNQIAGLFFIPEDQK
jgi:uncharacterized protein